MAGGAEPILPGVLAFGFRGYVNAGRIENRRAHLAGDKAFPDQIVKFRLRAVQVFPGFYRFGGVIRVAGPDCFMRFLGEFRLRFKTRVLSGPVARSAIFFDIFFRAGRRLVGQIKGIGAVVGDKADFVKLLRQLHREFGL